MKKSDKFKNFMKKTLFGEKLENALQSKVEIETPSPAAESKTDFSVVSKPIKNPFSENTPQASLELSSKSNSVEEKVATKNLLKAEKINEFLQIMERRFLENISPDNAVRVNLGIDLGTSFSKVVWRLGENSYPLCFGENPLNLTDYLVPSIVSFGKRTLMWSVETSEEESLFSLVNFKMCLACESEKNKTCNIGKCSLTKWHPIAFSSELKNDEAAFVNAYFLAKLLAQTKKLVIAELEKKGFRQPIVVKWIANFSVPEKFIEQSPVALAFEKVFKISWLMAEIFLEKPEINNRRTIFECYLMAKDLAEELEMRQKPFDCFSYSEISAEVASVVLSRTSEEGLYAFVDIGAGTVDASIFRFWRDDGETKLPSYTANIFKLGAAHIETRANKKFIRNSLDWLKDIKEKYIDLTENERGQLLKPIISFLKEASQDIKDETSESLIKVFSQAYHDKERDISKWQNLKLILGGGGAKLKTYQDAAKYAFSLNRETKDSKPPETVILPKPNDFQSGLPESEFHRFAVAYGLSHEIVNLPETIFAKDVAPIRQPSAHIGKNADWYEK